MKSQFSKTWKGSKQPRKQRKYLFNAPLHVLRKFMAAALSKDLKKKFGIRNVEVRKGDEVKVMRGKFKKKTGKVGAVDVDKSSISIEGIERTKKDGTKVEIWFAPSNVMITSLNLDDRKRLKRIGKGRVEEKDKKAKKEQETEDKKSGEKPVQKKIRKNKKSGRENVSEKK